MSAGFVRPAPWLRRLFTPSQTSPVNPTEISEDVSLIQPYDGGGYPLHPVGEYLETTTQTAGAAGNGDLITTGQFELARILCADLLITAGVIPTCFFRIQIGTVDVAISPRVVLGALNQPNSQILQSPILPPGAALQIAWSGGDAATIVRTHVLHALVPLGTVFYV